MQDDLHQKYGTTYSIMLDNTCVMNIKLVDICFPPFLFHDLMTS